MLEGTLDVANGARRWDAPAGTIVTVRRGVPHAWCNPSDTPLRMLVVFTPGMIEGLFSAAAGVKDVDRIISVRNHAARWNPVVLLEAAGLALFAVSGSHKALVYQLKPIMAALPGMLTGIGGGMMRDVLLAEIPIVLRCDLYAVAALAGAATVVTANVLQLPSGVAVLVGAALCFGLGVLAIHTRLAASPRAVIEIKSEAGDGDRCPIFVRGAPVHLGSSRALCTPRPGISRSRLRRCSVSRRAPYNFRAETLGYVCHRILNS